MYNLVSKSNFKKLPRGRGKKEDKLITSINMDTSEEEALAIIQYHILNPNHASLYNHLTYYDEVVLLCLLKDVDVTFNLDDCEYYIQESSSKESINVSSSVDKLIEAGYVNSETLKPNKNLLRRTYITHPYAIKEVKEDTRRVFLDYYIVEDLQGARSKWKAADFVTTIHKAFKTSKFKDERISFCTMINLISQLPREVTTKKTKSLLQYNTFDFNINRLNTITSVLLKEIQALLID